VLRKLFLVHALLLVSLMVNTKPLINITREAALRIGIKIWYNECGGKISGLTSWNEGERFASLGIGHFNWYPGNHPGATQDGFPQLIKYMERHGVTVPTWLQGENVLPCPWHNRTEFLSAQKCQKMNELRQFLVDTIPIQAQFMVYRLVNALPKLISVSPCEEREFVFRQFALISQTPQGIYALVDYVNFKGEGSGWFAQKHSGWGLLQVVEGMKNAPDSLNSLQAFVWSANRVLTERVRQAPPTSHEQKWLPGWRKRIYTYLE
jgi:hypothetical protein